MLETTLLPGVYYIRVSGYVSDDVNSYTLSLTGPLAGDDFEPNYGMEDATALPLGTTVSSFIFTRHDQDWYRIVTTADGHLVVTLNVPESVDYDLQLRDDLDRFVAVSGHFMRGQDEEIVTTVPAGTYFARVFGYGDYTQAHRYSLTAVSGAFTDTFEPNNTRASARRVGPGTLLSKMFSSTDEDWYRFNLSATGTVSILLEVPAFVSPAIRPAEWFGERHRQRQPNPQRGGRVPGADAHGPWRVFRPGVQSVFRLARGLHAEAGRRHNLYTPHAARRFRCQRRDGPGRLPVRNGHVAPAEPVRHPVWRTG